MKSIKNRLTNVYVLLITFIFVNQINCQSTTPSVFLSQIEMTPSGGQPYDEFYWLNSNNASLTKSGLNFPSTGSYRCDISAYLDKGTPIINVLIYGISKGNITVNTSSIGVFSLLISNISGGTHSITLRLI